MRLTFNMQFSQSLNGILTAQQRMAKAETQLSRQTRILSPADDPAGAAKTLTLEQNKAQIEQYQSNSILLKNNLGLQETVLTNMRGAMDRLLTLSIASGNGTYSDEERSTVAAEIKNIQTQLLDIMNTRSPDGSYIFAGFQDKVVPYEFDSAAGKYVFNGDEGARSLQISPSIAVPSTSSGKLIFDEVFERFQTGPANVVAGSPDTVKIEVTSQKQFDNFFRQQYDALTPSNNQFSVALDGVGNYEFLKNGASLTPPVTGPFTPGSPINFNGLTLTISGAAAAPGEVQFDLAPPQKTNILNAIDEFVTALNTPVTDLDVLKRNIQDMLVSVENTSNNISATLAQLGGRINVTDGVFNLNADLLVTNQQYQADVSEVDLAAALTEIKRQEVALQATSQVFAKIGSTTLFDYLR
ncbi:MAG: flagellar hook-associated protein FlgL [Alishewanella agri]|nr:flagellar hook-associated protein FlgL [Alishewanella agri]